MPTEIPGISRSIPMGCICSYTWGYLNLPSNPILIRNGPLRSCPADHESRGV